MSRFMIVLDTETCPMDTEINGVDPYNMLVYDIGYAVVDRTGKTYETHSFVVADVFYGEREMMKSGYYAKKLPQYYDDIENGTRVVADFYTIRKRLLETVEKYNVKEIYAHNARFDYGSLNNTMRWITKSTYRYYFPQEITVCDTLKMAKDVIAKMPTYIKFCTSNNFLNKWKKPKLSAEVLYKFISKNIDFVESHTGLEDVMIEKEIMAYCYKQHKKMRKALFDQSNSATDKSRKE